MSTKFRHQDTQLLFDTMEHVEGLLAAIETFGNESQDIPDESIVPTATLYNILTCYEAMFRKVLASELCVSANKLFERTSPN